MKPEVTLRRATEQDEDFLYQLLRTTMKGYVEQAWGWDEEWEHKYFQLRFEPSKDRIIVLEGEDIGVISTERQEGKVSLSKIYILPAYQGRGIGTQLIQGVLDSAFDEGLPVTLQVLQVDPARRLYERLGFVVVEELDERMVMQATPPG